MLKFTCGFVVALFICLPLTGQSGLTSKVHLNERDIPWPGLPDVATVDVSEEQNPRQREFMALAKVMQWKTLIGTEGRFGEGLPDRDLAFGTGEIGPGAIYPEHKHPTAELYYLVSGRAKWNVDGEEFIAEPGSAVYMKPFAVHSMEVLSDERAIVVWADWAPNCDRSVMHGGYELLGPVPEQPERAKIKQ